MFKSPYLDFSCPERVGGLPRPKRTSFLYVTSIVWVEYYTGTKTLMSLNVGGNGHPKNNAQPCEVMTSLANSSLEGL